MGKKIIFLPQCHSTNQELVDRSKKFDYPEGTVVYTDYQDSGRGQRGNKWQAEPGKNILMSVLLKPKFLLPSDQYLLNIISGLAIVDTIKETVGDTQVLLKWPNDVYLESKKVSGVLIESNFRGGLPESSIVGVGLNVNQGNFDLNTATSLKLHADCSYELDRVEIIERLLQNLEVWYLRLKNGRKDYILSSYHDLLMWRGELHTFKSKHCEFTGEIVGITDSGKLAIRVDDKLETFDIKEVEFIK